MAGTHDFESFEGSLHRPISSATEDAFRTLAMSAMTRGFDFRGMVSDAASAATSAAFGRGDFSLTDGDATIARGRIGEPTAGTVLKDGLKVLQKGFEVARDAVGVVRDGVTVLEDVMRDY